MSTDRGASTDQATARREPAPTDVVVAGRADDRPRSRRLLAPGAALAAGLAALGYLAAVDPNESGHYPVCPTKALFGVDCPGCGMLRGTHDLVTGNVPAALDHNVLLVVAVPLLVVLWVRWVARAWRGREDPVTYAQFRARNRIVVWGMVGLLAFGVVRNFVPYLGSGIG